jgi:hypothetical protein
MRSGETDTARMLRTRIPPDPGHLILGRVSLPGPLSGIGSRLPNLGISASSLSKYLIIPAFRGWHEIC